MSILTHLALGLTGIFGKPTPATPAKPIAMEQAADAYRDMGALLELDQSEVVTENGGDYGVCHRQRAATAEELAQFWGDFEAHNVAHAARVERELRAKR
jgi:hypothetical protein